MAETYISQVIIDLWTQELFLEWVGPKAADKPVGPFHCAPGCGMTNNNCDNEATSRRSGSNCTPKGIWKVLGYEKFWIKYPEATWVTRFQSIPRGIALHYYPRVPQWPASHGCVRIADEAIAKEIYYNTQPNKSFIVVQGELRPNLKLAKAFKRGDRGSDIKKLQKQLSNSGFATAIDGDFGPSTKATVTAFQTKHMGPSAADGVVGPATYNALFTKNKVHVTR